MEEKDEALKVIGKRQRLWNVQRQVYALKIEGKEITEEWLIKILDSLVSMQMIEEMYWKTENYMESEIEKDIVVESNLLNKKIKELCNYGR